jgi:hypothetical protein
MVRARFARGERVVRSWFRANARVVYEIVSVVNHAVGFVRKAAAAMLSV